ncbi:MAG TPA: Gfo/Idh/MocA family oxidoreductase [Pirellulales bacterium]|nr:Gfo/Idh/MocA family oxidoreductase [Pirellulales bacterium]
MTDRRVRLGVVGLQRSGRRLARQFSAAANCQLAAIADRDWRVLHEVRQRYPQAKVCQSLDELAADDTLDAIALATPGPTHAALARTAVLAGKHVYIQPPLTLSAAEVQELAALAQQVGRKILFGPLAGRDPVIESIQRQFDSGVLGVIHYVYCQQHSGTPRRQTLIPQQAGEDPCVARQIAMLLHLFAAEPEAISASGEPRGPEDGAGAIVVHLHFSRGMAQLRMLPGEPQNGGKITVVGSRRLLICDNLREVSSLRGFEPATVPCDGETPPLECETQQFIDWIRSNRLPRDDGLRTLRVLEQIDRQLSAAAAIAPVSISRRVA